MDKRLTLEKRIEAELLSYEGTMGFYGDDLKGNIIELGADTAYETASTIKTYILACLYDQVEQGKADLSHILTYEPSHMVEGSGVVQALDLGAKFRVKDAATLMIIVSDNVATNMIIEYLGIDTINACIQKLGCMHTTLHRTLHFDGEGLGRLGTTTPRDYASIFTRLAQKTLISPKADKEMLEIFSKQHYNKMITGEFPTALMDGDETGKSDIIHVASKSGSMDECRNDGGIVSTPYGDYVIVMMHKDFYDPQYHDTHTASKYGARVSRMVLDQYLALEGRFVL